VLPSAALSLILSEIALAQLTRPANPPSPAPADLILGNGHVYTPYGWGDSLAIHGGGGVAVGDAAVKPHINSKNRTIDLKGKTVLPGLHDMHVHPAGAGLGELQCKLPQDSSPEQIFAITAACVKAHKPGQWITGRAYEAAAFGATPPNKSMLDKVAPNNPVIFTDISGHSSWANSMALLLAGINRDTANPVGGIIERDVNGEPTGLLREAASGLVSRLILPPTPAETAQGLKWALDTMLVQGLPHSTTLLLAKTSLRRTRI